jgi:hypothetical protein
VPVKEAIKVEFGREKTAETKRRRRLGADRKPPPPPPQQHGAFFMVSAHTDSRTRNVCASVQKVAIKLKQSPQLLEPVLEEMLRQSRAFFREAKVVTSGLRQRHRNRQAARHARVGMDPFVLNFRLHKAVVRVAPTPSLSLQHVTHFPFARPTVVRF